MTMWVRKCLFFAVLLSCMLSTIEQDTAAAADNDNDSDLDADEDYDNTTHVDRGGAAICEDNMYYYCWHHNNPLCRVKFRRADYNHVNGRGCSVVTKCQYNETIDQTYRMKCFTVNHAFAWAMRGNRDLTHHIAIRLLTANGSTFRSTIMDLTRNEAWIEVGYWIMTNRNDQVTSSFVVKSYYDCNRMTYCWGPPTTESSDDGGDNSISLTTTPRPTGVDRYEYGRSCPSEEIRRCEAPFHKSCTKIFRASNDSIAYGCVVAMDCIYNTSDSRIGVLCFVEDNAFPLPLLPGFNKDSYVYHVVVSPRGNNVRLAKTEFNLTKSAAMSRIRQAINNVISTITSFTIKTSYNCNEMALCILNPDWAH